MVRVMLMLVLELELGYGACIGGQVWINALP